MALYLVMMRQPRGADDSRFECYWEGGSFGRTGCHSKNLLHHRNCPIVPGDRLGFVQGARGEFRLVGLTPPVNDVTGVGDGRRLEVLWDASYRPFRFECAPVLINNNGRSDFPLFAGGLSLGGRTTPVGAIGSQFRTRSKPLADHLAAELAVIFDGWKGAAADSYIETIRPLGDRWREQALRRGWDDLEARRRQYEALGRR